MTQDNPNTDVLLDEPVKTGRPVPQIPLDPRVKEPEIKRPGRAAEFSSSVALALVGAAVLLLALQGFAAFRPDPRPRWPPLPSSRGCCRTRSTTSGRTTRASSCCWVRP